MNSFWNQSPIIRALIPFVMGIVIMINYPFSADWLPIVFLSLVLASIAIHYFVKTPSLTFARLTGVLLFITLFFTGLYLTHWNNLSNHTEFAGNYLDSTQSWIVYVNDPPVPSENSIQVPVEIRHAHMDSNLHHVVGNAILYLEKDSAAQAVAYGDILQIENRLEPVEEPRNPNEFNYKKYLSFHQVYHRAYFPSEAWRQTGNNEGKGYLIAIYSLREHLLSIIQENFVHESSVAVAGALLIGYRDLLDRETIRNYSGTGAMHVLAVSGLHVGIIFLLLKQLLPSDRSRKWYQRGLRPAIFLLGIWFYALLTGMSPSVSRAATMFSFVIMGGVLDRPLNIYNSIGASAFFLLLLDPFLITEIGFLLSYFAVIGIVYLQPKLYKHLYVKNWLLDKAWAITCVSIAAQIATFPIGILFFYQFPTFFFISNLLVIPAAMIIVMGGMSMFIFSSIGSLKASLGFFLSWIIEGLNTGIALINQIPGSLLDGLVINIPQAVFIYLFIIFFVLFLVYYHQKWLRYAMVFATMFFALTAYFSLERWQHRSITIYSVNDHTALAIMNGKSGTVLADSALMNNESAVRFNMLHHWWNAGVKDPRVTLLDSTSPVTKIEVGKKSLVISNSLDKIPGGDWLLLRNDPWLDESKISDLQQFDKIILDGSNSYYRKALWKEKLADRNITYHDVVEDGAFTWSP